MDLLKWFAVAFVAIFTYIPFRLLLHHLGILNFQISLLGTAFAMAYSTAIVNGILYLWNRRKGKKVSKARNVAGKEETGLPKELMDVIENMEKEKGGSELKRKIDELISKNTNPLEVRVFINMTHLSSPLTRLGLKYYDLMSGQNENK